MQTLNRIGEAPRSSPFLRLWHNPNFRLLWIGEGVSVLGDHFYLIALPWLVLQMTGDSLAMGTVLALSAIPRALFMLVGGALTDRFSPRWLMIVSNLARFILVGVLAGLVFAGLVQMWMLYAFAVLFGLADAFFYPAQNSITPRIVEKEDLQPANSLVHGTMMLAMLAGPALAGVLIAVLDGGETGSTRMLGIAAALGLDALTFLVSLVTLLGIRLQPHGAQDSQGNILRSIRSGLAYAWRDVPLRAYFLVVAAITFFFTGPFNIGIPLLADARFPEGAAAYGAILSAWGAGSLIGMALAGILPSPGPGRMGARLLGLVSGMGIGLAALGVSASTGVAVGISLALGASNGYVNIFFMTWVQNRASRAFIGRLMSLLMFASTGLYPVSTALAGAVSRIDVTQLLLFSGGMVALVALLASLNRTVRMMEPVVQEAES